MLLQAYPSISRMPWLTTVITEIWPLASNSVLQDKWMAFVYHNFFAPTYSVLLAASRSLLDAAANIELGSQGAHELIQAPVPVDCLHISMLSVVR